MYNTDKITPTSKQQMNFSGMSKENIAAFPVPIRMNAFTQPHVQQPTPQSAFEQMLSHERSRISVTRSNRNEARAYREMHRRHTEEHRRRKEERQRAAEELMALRRNVVRRNGIARNATRRTVNLSRPGAPLRPPTHGLPSMASRATRSSKR
jgi:hypothetical protein